MQVTLASSIARENTRGGDVQDAERSTDAELSRDDQDVGQSTDVERSRDAERLTDDERSRDVLDDGQSTDVELSTEFRDAGRSREVQDVAPRTTDLRRRKL